MGCEVCGSPTRPWRLGADALIDRCRRCGHLHRDLVAAPARHRDHAYGGEPTLDRLRLALTHRTLRRRWRQPARAQVFEIGYGSGALLRRFLDSGAAVSGTDPDQLAVDVDPVVAESGHLEHLPVELLATERLEPYDLVYGVHVLEHVGDPQVTIARAAALVAPGGCLQFLTPAGDSLGLAVYRSHWWMLEDPTHLRFFSADSLRLLAEQAGLVDVQVSRPVFDSLVTDAASWARWWHRARSGRRDGVLASRSVLAIATVSSPLVVLIRLLVPRARPTVHLVAHRPAAAP